MNTLQKTIHDMAACSGLQELLDTARWGTRSPLILANAGYAILAITEDEDITDPRWRQIKESQTLPTDLVNVAAYQSALQSGRPVVSVDATGLPVTRCAVTQGKRLIGYLLCPGYGGMPTEEELDILTILADLCSIRMQKDMDYDRYPEDMLAFFISDLLAGTVEDEQIILERCRRFRWEPKLPYRVAVLQRQEQPRMTSGADFLTLGEICAAFQTRFPDATAFLHGNQIKAIIPVHDKTTRDALILSDLEGFMAENAMVGGVSQTMGRVKNIHICHRQAETALKLGLLLAGSGPLFHYNKYAVYDCLEACAEGADILSFCHPAVLLLESYDRKNNTELLGTLHAYLSCRQNACEAAAALFVHRNTLSKRLERINDLIRVDLSDTETVFHLMFSYRIMEYYGATAIRQSYESWMARSPNLRHP